MAENNVDVPLVTQQQVREIVDAQVRMAVVASLGSTSEEIVSEMVKQVLNMKSRSSGYGSPQTTVMQELVNTRIEAVAREVVDTWVEENKDKLREAIRNQIEGDGTFIGKVTEAIATSFASLMRSDISVSIKD